MDINRDLFEEEAEKDKAQENSAQRIARGKTAALKFIKSKDKTVSEISKELKKKGFDEGDILEIIEILSEFDLIDDEKYCQNYIEEGIRKKKGRNRLKYELQDKGIGKELVLNSLYEYYSHEEEEENAKEAFYKIIGFGVPDKKKLDKAFNKLKYLGYENSLIFSLIEKNKQDSKSENFDDEI